MALVSPRRKVLGRSLRELVDRETKLSHVVTPKGVTFQVTTKRMGKFFDESRQKFGKVLAMEVKRMINNTGKDLEAWRNQATEDQEQMAFVEYIEKAHPNLVFFAVPNGEERPSKENDKGERYSLSAQRLKRLGVKSGVPDLVFAEPRGQFHGLYVEMKRRKGGKESEAQKKWRADLWLRGYKSVVCAGVDDAILQLNGYLAQGPFDGLWCSKNPKGKDQKK